jgi:hypothetical protein
LILIESKKEPNNFEEAMKEKMSGVFPLSNSKAMKEEPNTLEKK